MRIKNSQLQKAVQEISPAQSELLATFVKEAAKSRSSVIKDRAELFFQAEPFAREFDEYRLSESVSKRNIYGYSMGIQLNYIGVKQKGKQHRATLFAWLSYYHQEAAEAYCAKIGANIPPYDGHPDLNECSAEAIRLFERQERSSNKSGPDIEVHAAPLPEGTEPENESATNDSGSTEGCSEEQERKSDKGPNEAAATQSSHHADGRPASLQGRSKDDKSGKRKLVVIGSLVALLLVSGAVAVNLSIFGVSSEGQNTADEPASSDLAVNDDPASSEETSKDENGTNSNDAGAAESEAENEPVVPTPQLSREIDPVWNNITGFAWSTKELNYFYPTLRSANQSDLQEAARQGNTAAQALLGVAHHSGWLGQTDHSLAIREYLRPACANGQGLAQGRACALLGVQYGSGLGVPKNNATAAEFYSKACRLGNLTGCHYEGVRYLNGDGVARDLPRAITIFKDACELGVGYSCLNLSDIYGQGTGVEKDLELAKRYQQRYQQLRTPI